MDRTFTLLGAGLAFLAVALGAFGAHGLRDWFVANPARLPLWQTAVQYHLVHALGVLIVALALARTPMASLEAAGWCFGVGVVVFSGSLYLLSVDAVPRWWGAITPFGGFSFLAGWAFLAWSAWKA